MKKITIALALAGLATVVQANDLKYLEQKTVYCFSENSLAKYLNLAKDRNLNGMNKLVLKGECDFVPDGNIYRLSYYHKDMIDDTPVIAFELNDRYLWTFQALVQNTNLSNL
ncbi:hypothetical protein [Kaarinaea lacus]